MADAVYLSLSQLSERFGVAPQSLRSAKNRPPAIRIGNSLRFRLPDVEAWEEEQIRKSQATDSAVPKPGKFMTARQVADRLGMSVQALAANRMRRLGLPYFKFGVSVRYLTADVEAYEASAQRHIPLIARSRANW